MDHSTFFPPQHNFFYDETLHLQTTFPHDDLIATPHSAVEHHPNNHGMNQSNMFTVYSPLTLDPIMAPVHELPHLEIPLTGGTGAATSADETPLHTPGGHIVDTQLIDQYASIDRPSSSEDKDLTSAQVRRKAQNRAAQRAFRERKEKHVKELETKLDDLQSATTSLATDNQRLKLMLQKAMTENEMLRASSGSRRPAPFLLFPDEDGHQSSDRTGHTRGGNEHMEADDEASDGADEQELIRRKGKAVYTQTAVWDFLIDHPLILRGHVDIQDAWDRVKRVAKNSVDGPVYLEGDIKRAIERSRKGGGDALV